MKKINFNSRNDLFNGIKIGDIIEYSEDPRYRIRMIIIKNNKIFLSGYSLTNKMNSERLVVDSPIRYYTVYSI